MLAYKTLKLSVKSLKEFARKRLPDDVLIDLDARDECPIEIVRDMCSPDKLGIQLLFIPEEFGGMGGGTFDVYCICEEMARIDLGIATSVLATFLGSDPITVGATPEQKKLWLSRIADEGLLFAYGATEPEAGSDLGALRTTADRVLQDGRVAGYKINGNKQWISNGGVAGAYTVLANTPGGPSWFIVEKGAKGFTHDEPEDKHGIRLSNTAALAFNDVYVDADRLIGGVEGQGSESGTSCLRLHALDGRSLWPGSGMGCPRSRDSLFHQAHSGWCAAFGKAGVHTQTDRAARGAIGSRTRLHRRDCGEDRRWRGKPEHGRRHCEIHGDRGWESSRRCQHPGTRRLRLYPRIHRGEDQARCPHHHDLRGYVRDHGDDHQPRPLAASLEDARPVLP